MHDSRCKCTRHPARHHTTKELIFFLQISALERKGSPEGGDGMLPNIDSPRIGSTGSEARVSALAKVGIRMLRIHAWPQLCAHNCFHFLDSFAQLTQIYGYANMAPTNYRCRLQGCRVCPTYTKTRCCLFSKRQTR